MLDSGNILCDPLLQVPGRKEDRMRLYGVADIAEGGCKKIFSKETWEATRPDHAVPGGFPPKVGDNQYAADSVFAWELTNMRKFERPVKLTHWPAGGPWARWQIGLDVPDDDS